MTNLPKKQKQTYYFITLDDEMVRNLVLKYKPQLLKDQIKIRNMISASILFLVLSHFKSF